MGRVATSLLAIGLGLAAVMLLASCGGEDAQLLPGETAREITDNLDKVRQLSDEGDCIGAESAAQQVGEQIEALGGVDRKLKQALQAGAEKLNEVVTKCEESTEAVAPAEVPTTEEPAGKKAEKEAREKHGENATPTTPGEAPQKPSLPPQANGEGKGLENGGGPPESEEGGESSPSGGVSPSQSAGEN
jgi:hypothetical protein